MSAENKDAAHGCVGCIVLVIASIVIGSIVWGCNEIFSDDCLLTKEMADAGVQKLTEEYRGINWAYVESGGPDSLKTMTGLEGCFDSEDSHEEFVEALLRYGWTIAWFEPQSFLGVDYYDTYWTPPQ